MTRKAIYTSLVRMLVNESPSQRSRQNHHLQTLLLCSDPDTVLCSCVHNLFILAISATSLGSTLQVSVIERDAQRERQL